MMITHFFDAKSYIGSAPILVVNYSIQHSMRVLNLGFSTHHHHWDAESGWASLKSWFKTFVQNQYSRDYIQETWQYLLESRLNYNRIARQQYQILSRYQSIYIIIVYSPNIQVIYLFLILNQKSRRKNGFVEQVN